ncbi:DUF6508 domain-containing protein [Microbulbifer sp. GL-2]|uniref:DUF6508 domain-containing protein n=1 Tax=Microbulbifer sp. GL-2 TaxID=2591606 RepID=UPI001163BF3C|nr:DUF6508 domain-containing protein [Microbulbifer sp. GL-2]BBM03780.1 hypothetical protein GL2_38540 [Microbulbifer sp. GL-2]
MNVKDVKDLVSAYNSAMSEVPNIDKSDHYPVYPDEISEFMRILQLDPWIANDYKPVRTREILDTIESASIKEVRWVLTAAARSERFGDGSWVKILEEKMLDPVIKRLQVLSVS